MPVRKMLNEKKMTQIKLSTTTIKRSELEESVTEFDVES